MKWVLLTLGLAAAIYLSGCSEHDKDVIAGAAIGGGIGHILSK